MIGTIITYTLIYFAVGYVTALLVAESQARQECSFDGADFFLSLFGWPVVFTVFTLLGPYKLLEWYHERRSDQVYRKRIARQNREEGTT